jgi:hypothetical protein
MSHWLDYHMLLVINYFVFTILITPKLVRGSGAVTPVRIREMTGHSGCKLRDVHQSVQAC